MFDAHTYPKGARVLHMLRALLGDGPFFETLSRFLHRYAFDAVDTADFIRSVKTVTGRNLDWFFDQWLFRPGHPVFEVESAWDAAAKAVRRDPDSRVRAAALVALGDLKDRAHLEFYKALFRRDPSYRVQAEALTAIGKTGDPSAVPFLEEAAAVPSYRHMVRRAAEAALGRLVPAKK